MASTSQLLRVIDANLEGYAFAVLQVSDITDDIMATILWTLL